MKINKKTLENAAVNSNIINFYLVIKHLSKENK